MNTKRILGYLHELAANNNRDWFHEHKKEYDVCRKDFEEGVAQAVATIARMPPWRISRPRMPAIASIATRVSAKTKAPIRTISGHTSAHTARNRCAAATIFTCNPANAYWV